MNTHLWYEEFGRKSLPWRNTDDAYAIYISEMMLQQTQVKTVLERFYHPFLERFPSLQSIADAPLDELLFAWQGLGYYRRAHYIHACAKTATPALPGSVEELVKLPGIGKTTAHAIMAFAYRRPYPVLEANVKRIIRRFFALENPTEKRLWESAYQLLDNTRPFDFNQAMMDIGAMICTPKEPKCSVCPLNSDCLGKDAPQRYLAAASGRKRPTRRVTLCILRRNGTVYLRQSRENLLGGLWQFPQYGLQEHPFPSAVPIGEITHHYTHFRLEATVFTAEIGEEASLLEDGKWIEITEFASLPTSSLEKKVWQSFLRFIASSPEP